MTKIVELIYTNAERRGDGLSDESPYRMVEQWFTKKGILVFEIDPCKSSHNAHKENT